jgi:2-amino-4-hydroxy-6-hydroxymethyldihydropteridine diphosphokinase
MARRTPTEAFLALGGNLGDVLARFRDALDGLGRAGVEVVAVSSAYRTRALVAPGAAPGPDYWNAVVRVRTTLTARQLLALAHRIEAAAGRERRARWEARPLDIDLLTFGDAVIHGHGIEVPHPRLHERAFVLVPWAEIAPEARVPPGNVTVEELRTRLGAVDADILERRTGISWW